MSRAADNVCPTHISDRLQRARVLVVDDSSVGRSLLQDVFACVGLEIAIASTAAAAQKQLADKQMDLMILSGDLLQSETQQTLKAAKTLAVPPAVILTLLQGSLGDGVLHSPSIVTDYLYKPFDPNEVLVRSYRAVMGRPAAFPPSSADLTQEGRAENEETGEAAPNSPAQSQDNSAVQIERAVRDRVSHELRRPMESLVRFADERLRDETQSIQGVIGVLKEFVSASQRLMTDKRSAVQTTSRVDPGENPRPHLEYATTTQPARKKTAVDNA